LRDEIVDMLDDDKAEDIVVIELSGKSSLGDYMIIATGRSNRQIAAMADHIVRKLKASGLKGITPEGLRQRDWVVVDAGDVIVHLFRPEVREFYNLEKMWGADLGEAQASTR
jgi:ribosome-associated protein